MITTFLPAGPYTGASGTSFDSGMLLDEGQGVAVGLQRLCKEVQLFVQVFFVTNLAAAVEQSLYEAFFV